MANIIERYDSQRYSIGMESPSLERIYMVTGTEEADEAASLVGSVSPALIGPLIFQSYDLEHIGGGVWEAVVRYGKREVQGMQGNTLPGNPPPPTTDHTFQFDTTGGTKKLVESLENIWRVAPPGGGNAPDCKRAIGVNNDTVEGVEVVTPVYKFSESHSIADSLVTQAYKLKLFNMTGKVNNAGFRGFAAGEVLFLGAQGSKAGYEEWKLTFSFACSLNKTNINIGGITNFTVPSKKGWEYLWIIFGDTVSENSLVKQPKYAYVERVYETAGFADLGIGVD